jgi:ABC-type cobalamin/Fe3+-siderophores transport system ATPase subunit
METAKPFEHDDMGDVEVLAEEGQRLEALLDLEETEWDDLQTIFLNDRPINETSPGQRSSALLPLIALSETTPLVIDQPEDNLDKHLIGQVLSRVLARLKEKRQIIVCTHDPNILVGGDAEQVVVLEAMSNRKGQVAQDGHGSIDNANIVATVVDILEGGRDAFENRSKRYGLST